MTPEDLAEKHPKLYHVTEPGAWASIKKHGLQSTSRLLDLFEVRNPQRILLESKRRARAIPLCHPSVGQVILNDQAPLFEKALEKCLDDSLTPSDWLKILNARVFFWASEEGLNRHLQARLNRTRSREVLVLDTLSLAKKHQQQIEICPINSGTTFRKAARRGLETFTPLLKYPYATWSKLRGQRDKIHEVTVLGGVADIEEHLLEVAHASYYP